MYGQSVLLQLLNESNFRFYYNQQLGEFRLIQHETYGNSRNVYYYKYMLNDICVAMIKTKHSIRRYNHRLLSLDIYSCDPELIYLFIDTYRVEPYTYVFCLNKYGKHTKYDNIMAFTYSYPHKWLDRHGYYPLPRCIIYKANIKYRTFDSYCNSDYENIYSFTKTLIGDNLSNTRFLTTKSARK